MAAVELDIVINSTQAEQSLRRLASTTQQQISRLESSARQAQSRALTPAQSQAAVPQIAAARAGINQALSQTNDPQLVAALRNARRTIEQRVNQLFPRGDDVGRAVRARINAVQQRLATILQREGDAAFQAAVATEAKTFAITRSAEVEAAVARQLEKDGVKLSAAQQREVNAILTAAGQKESSTAQEKQLDTVSENAQRAESAAILDAAKEKQSQVTKEKTRNAQRNAAVSGELSGISVLSNSQREIILEIRRRARALALGVRADESLSTVAAETVVSLRSRGAAAVSVTVADETLAAATTDAAASTSARSTSSDAVTAADQALAATTTELTAAEQAEIAARREAAAIALANARSGAVGLIEGPRPFPLTEAGITALANRVPETLEGGATGPDFRPLRGFVVEAPQEGSNFTRLLRENNGTLEQVRAANGQLVQSTRVGGAALQDLATQVSATATSTRQFSLVSSRAATVGEGLVGAERIAAQATADLALVNQRIVDIKQATRAGILDENRGRDLLRATIRERISLTRLANASTRQRTAQEAILAQVRSLEIADVRTALRATFADQGRIPLAGRGVTDQSLRDQLVARGGVPAGAFPEGNAAAQRAAAAQADRNQQLAAAAAVERAAQVERVEEVQRLEELNRARFTAAQALRAGAVLPEGVSGTRVGRALDVTDPSRRSSFAAATVERNERFLVQQQQALQASTAAAFAEAQLTEQSVASRQVTLAAAQERAAAEAASAEAASRDAALLRAQSRIRGASPATFAAAGVDPRAASQLISQTGRAFAAGATNVPLAPGVAPTLREAEDELLRLDAALVETARASASASRAKARENQATERGTNFSSLHARRLSEEAEASRVATVSANESAAAAIRAADATNRKTAADSRSSRELTSADRIAVRRERARARREGGLTGPGRDTGALLRGVGFAAGEEFSLPGGEPSSREFRRAVAELQRAAISFGIPTSTLGEGNRPGSAVSAGVLREALVSEQIRLQASQLGAFGDDPGLLGLSRRDLQRQLRSEGGFDRGGAIRFGPGADDIVSIDRASSARLIRAIETLRLEPAARQRAVGDGRRTIPLAPGAPSDVVTIRDGIVAQEQLTESTKLHAATQQALAAADIELIEEVTNESEAARRAALADGASVAAITEDTEETAEAAVLQSQLNNLSREELIVKARELGLVRRQGRGEVISVGGGETAPFSSTSRSRSKLIAAIEAETGASTTSAVATEATAVAERAKTTASQRALATSKAFSDANVVGAQAAAFLAQQNREAAAVVEAKTVTEGADARTSADSAAADRRKAAAATSAAVGLDAEALSAERAALSQNEKITAAIQAALGLEREAASAAAVVATDEAEIAAKGALIGATEAEVLAARELTALKKTELAAIAKSVGAAVPNESGRGFRLLQRDGTSIALSSANKEQLAAAIVAKDATIVTAAASEAEAAAVTASAVAAEGKTAAQQRGASAAGLSAAAMRAEAQAASQNAVEELRKKVLLQQQDVSNTELVGLKAQEAVDQRRLNRLIQAETRRRLRRATDLPFTERFGLTRPGGFGGGGGGVLGGTLGTTLRFGASSALLFGIAGGLAASIGEATELQRELSLVEGQFQALSRQANQADIAAALDVGDFDEADRLEQLSLDQAGREFELFSDQVREIAGDTGQSASEIAQVGFQLQGAFGGDTLRTLSETRAAVEAIRVTGLTLDETTDAFTALTQNFDDADVSIREVSDSALGLQDRFGVLAKETISFAADLSPVAAQAGFTVQELEALGAAAQQFSGRSGSSLAEAFGRIFPSIQDNNLELVNFFRSIEGELEGSLSASGLEEADQFVENIITSLGSGNTRDFFVSLLESYEQLSTVQQNVILTTLGGRRETQALVGVLENADAVLAEFNGTFDDAGTTAERFGDLQGSLAQQLAELGAQFRELGIAVFEGGLGDALQQLLVVLSQIGTLVGGLLSVVGGFNDVLGGVPIQLLAIVAAGRLLAPVLIGVGQAAQSAAASSAAAVVAARTAAASAGARGLSGISQDLALLAPGARPGVAPRLNVGRGLGQDLRALGGAPRESLSSLPVLAGPTRGAAVRAGATAFGRGALAALGGPVGVGLIGGLVATQLISGFRDRARDEAREAAEATTAPLSRGLSQLVADAEETGDRLGRALDFRTILDDSSTQRLFDLASGRDAEGVGGFSTAEAIQNTPALIREGGEEVLSVLPRLFGFDVDGADLEAFERSDAEREQIIAAQRALTEQVGQQASGRLSDFLDASDEAFLELGDRIFAAEGFSDSSGTFLTTGAGGTDPVAVLEALGDNLSPEELLAGFVVGGERIAASREDFELLTLDLARGAQLTEEQITLLQGVLGSDAFNEFQSESELARQRAEEVNAQLTEGADSVEEATRKFELGTLSLGGYLQALEFAREGAQGLAAAGDDRQAEQVVEFTQDIEKALTEATSKQFDVAIELQQALQGEGFLPEQELALLQQKLAAPGLSEEDQTETANRIVDVQRQILEAQIDNVGSAAEALELQTAGSAVDVNAATQILEDQLRNYNVGFQQFLQGLGLGELQITEVTNEVAARMVETGESLEAATLAVLEAEVRLLEAQLESLEGISGPFAADIFVQIQGRLDELNALIDGIGDDAFDDIFEPVVPGQITAESAPGSDGLTDAEREARDEARQVADIQRQIERAQTDNPLLQALLDKKQAEIDLSRAIVDRDKVAIAQARLQLVESGKAIRDVQRSIQDINLDIAASFSENPVQQALFARQQADIDLARAIADDNPLAQGAAIIAQGEADRNLRDALEAISDAKLNLATANADGAFDLATIAQQQAADDLAAAQLAGDEAAILNAQAAQIQADQQLEDAFKELAEARRGILIAEAQAADDQVGVAELELQNAQDALREALALSPGLDRDLAVANATAAITTAQDQLFDAQIDEQIAAQQFLFDTGKISRQQFVAFLESLLQQKDLSTQDIRDITLQIQSLKDQLGGDFQFNLPTTLGLPTLFEARRVTQTPVGQSGIVDNRNINIVLNINNGLDLTAAEQLLADSLGRTTVGFGTRRTP